MSAADLVPMEPVVDWQRPLRDVDWVVPRTLDEAVAEAEDEGAGFIAGGTYLVRFARWGGRLPSTLIHLGRIGDLRRIGEQDGRAFVGAGAVHSDLEGHAALASGCDVLWAAAREIAGPAVRNLGTVGGNVAIDWDLGPALMALDADVLLRTRGGAQTVPLTGFYESDGSARLPRATIIEGVTLDTSLKRQAYRKAARRRGVSRAIVGVAVALDADDEVCRDVRIGIGGASLRSRRLTDAEDRLRGQVLTPDALAEAGELAWEATADAGDDVEASAWYVREMARVMTERALGDVIDAGP